MESIWTVAKIPDSALDDYIDLCGVCRPIALSLCNKNIKPPQVDQYFQASLSALTDPYRLPQMKIAIKRIWQAVQMKQKIIIHGDYDTDGVTSATLIHWVLSAYGADVDVFISNRMDDGYGPTSSTIDKCHKKGAKLVISCDCGITAFDAATRAKEIGIDFIITDHHNPARTLPDAFAIVDPRLHPELSDLHGLAGVGVAFKLCHGFVKYAVRHGVKKRPIDIREGLDLVAMGTIADVSPLIGENRSLVRNGLKLINVKRRAGLSALCEVARLDGPVTVSDVSRRLAPKINAAGRVGDPMVSVDLLQSKTDAESKPFAAILEKYNRKRRYAEKKALKEAMQAAEEEMRKYDPEALVIRGHNWHPGVIGLLATRISRQYSCPAIVVSYDENSNELVGSGRSKVGVDILERLQACDSMLNSFGGHPMAVGLSLDREDYNDFKQAFLSKFHREYEDTHRDTKNIFADGQIEIVELSDEFFEQYEQMEPFGSANKESIYYLDHVEPIEIIEFGDGNCKGMIEDLTGQISFVAYGVPKDSLPPGPWEMMVSPTVSVRGRHVIRQLHVHEVRTK